MLICPAQPKLVVVLVLIVAVILVLLILSVVLLILLVIVLIVVVIFRPAGLVSLFQGFTKKTEKRAG